ncbi:hypothetical protein D3C86_1418240 [compost metagenome]
MQPLRFFENRAVIRFHRPDGENDVLVDIEVTLDPVEGRRVLHLHFAADPHRVRIDAGIEIIPDLRGEFRLEGGLAQRIRIRLADTGKGLLIGRLANAFFRGCCVELVDPLSEPRICVSRNGRQRDCQTCNHHAAEFADT